MPPLSTYILTNNSQKYLAQILERLARVADEIVIVDSGSSDRTEEICSGYSQLKFIVRPLDDFKTQRNFAADCCRYDWVLFLDSDEIPDDTFLAAIEQLKAEGFAYDAYEARRKWYVLGQAITNMYPVVSPDHTIRLFNKKIVSFNQDSNRIHETPYGYKSLGKIEGQIDHHTMETKAEIARKLEAYTDLASQDLLARKPKPSLWAMIFSPYGAFIKWYLIRKGYRDGRLGLFLGKYAFDYTRKKYRKARSQGKKKVGERLT